MSAVVDTSALIGLHHLRLLRLLPLIFGPVCIPQAVLDEWFEDSAEDPEEAAAIEQLPKGWLQVRQLGTAFQRTELKLGFGEEEVISLAQEIGAEYVVLDDLPARELTVLRGLKVIGTVGVLVAARRRGVIPAVAPLLNGLRQNGFRIGNDIMEVIRNQEHR